MVVDMSHTSGVEHTHAITTVGVVGTGRLGTAVARLALEAGYPTYVTGRDTPINAMIVETTLPGAHWVTPAELWKHADAVILAIPQEALHTLEPTPGTLLIDATNAWDDAPEVNVPELFPNNPVVKTLNHTTYSELHTEAHLGRAMGVAGAEEYAVAVDKLISDMGFDPVRAPARALTPGQPFFGRRFTAEEFALALESYVH